MACLWRVEPQAAYGLENKKKQNCCKHFESQLTVNGFPAVYLYDS